jgi:UDP-N-acetyl-D-mannosaminuronic acid dehydrogenase
LTTTNVAEFVKIVENTYRDVNIAFANELSIFAEELGIDVWETIALANAHPRVDILSPGPGVGGHCIPVDPHFLSDVNPFVTELIQAARRVNERMPNRIVLRLAQLVGPPAGQKIALLGASYKADVDDGRESPTLRIDALLRERGYTTAIFDPIVRAFPRPLCDTLREAVEDADAVVLVTAHQIFSRIAPGTVSRLMRTRRLIDTRNFFDTVDWCKAGFECYTLGRPTERRHDMEPV